MSPVADDRILEPSFRTEITRLKTLPLCILFEGFRNGRKLFLFAHRCPDDDPHSLRRNITDNRVAVLGEPTSYARIYYLK